jgi:glutathione S-transferase
MRLYDYAGSGNAYKVRLLLAQLDIPYERIPISIFTGESRTPRFLAKNPAGRVPVLELDDGRCLAESNAILWYLARGTSLLPEDPFEQSQVLQWLFFEQYEVEPVIGTARFWVLTGRAAARPAELQTRMEAGTRTLAEMNRHLASRDFFVAQKYTIADVALYAYTHVAAEAGFDLRPLPALRAWFERVAREPRFVPGPDAYDASAYVAS